ncbi:MAG: transcriptional repressor, partial [Acidobacteriota bacterium]
MAFPELDKFLEILRREGHRITQERLQLFREIYEHHTHIDADQLLSSMKARGRKISRATLYR